MAHTQERVGGFAIIVAGFTRPKKGPPSTARLKRKLLDIVPNHQNGSCFCSCGDHYRLRNATMALFHSFTSGLFFLFILFLLILREKNNSAQWPTIHLIESGAWIDFESSALCKVLLRRKQIGSTRTTGHRDQPFNVLGVLHRFIYTS